MTQASPTEGPVDSRPFLGEACGFCKRFPAWVGPILRSSHIKDQLGITPSLRVLWVLMKTQHRAETGEAAGNVSMRPRAWCSLMRHLVSS